MTLLSSLLPRFRYIVPVIILCGTLISVSSCGKKVSHQSKRKFKSWGMNEQQAPGKANVVSPAEKA